MQTSPLRDGLIDARCSCCVTTSHCQEGHCWSHSPAESLNAAFFPPHLTFCLLVLDTCFMQDWDIFRNRPVFLQNGNKRSVDEHRDLLYGTSVGLQIHCLGFVHIDFGRSGELFWAIKLWKQWTLPAQRETADTHSLKAAAGHSGSFNTQTNVKHSLFSHTELNLWCDLDKMFKAARTRLLQEASVFSSGLRG